MYRYANFEFLVIAFWGILVFVAPSCRKGRRGPCRNRFSLGAFSLGVANYGGAPKGSKGRCILSRFGVATTHWYMTSGAASTLSTLPFGVPCVLQRCRVGPTCVHGAGVQGTARGRAVTGRHLPAYRAVGAVSAAAPGKGGGLQTPNRSHQDGNSPGHGKQLCIGCYLTTPSLPAVVATWQGYI